MGVILPESKENEIVKYIRKDDETNLIDFIKLNQLPPDLLITNHKRNLIQLSCYFESPKCLSKLIEMNYDYNKIENSTGDTPLFICSKFNNLEMVKILLAKEDCKKLVKNFENFNEFDISFIKGNYNICYYLMYEYDNKGDDNNNINNDDNDDNININNEKNISTKENLNDNNNEKSKNKNKKKEKDSKKNTSYNINQIYQKYFYNTDFEYDYYLTLQSENKCPLFNMPLFFKCLCNKTPPEECPSFAPEKKKTLDLTTKIPDPNESWGHFFKRVVNMELYNPPLVDKKNVSVMNSMYMNTQMKLLENEYGIKMGYYKRNDDSGDDETQHPLDKDESEVIQIKKKIKNKKLNNNAYKRTEDNNEESDEIQIKDIDDNNNEIDFNNDNVIINKSINKNKNKDKNKEKEDDNNMCIIKIGNENSSERNIDNK